MSRVTIVLGESDIKPEGCVIGVDYGAFVCARDGVEMILACGDFDSVSDGQFHLIESVTRVDRLNPIKDMTDFEHALTYTKDYDEILVLGGLGNRRDHEYVNIILASKDSRITLMDSINRIKKYDAGVHRIVKGDYQYCSFIVIDEGMITLDRFKYPLVDRKIHVGDTYLTSNEIVGDEGTLTLDRASVLCIQT